MKRFLPVFFALFLLVGVAAAQDDRGRISGLVSDPTGAVVSHAEVSLLNEATGVETKTVSNGEGSYTFDLLISGLYTVEVNVPGFKKFSLHHVRIESGGRVGVPVKLTVGRIDDVITVSATNATQLKTEDAVIGFTMETRSVEELPAINIADLQWMTPGVASTTLTNGSGAESTSVNGMQSGRTEFTLDGAPNSRNGGSVTVAFTPAEKMVDEFHVTTSPYDASQAHTGGASMDVSLKSGTKDFHGSFYGKYENPNVNAPQFSQSAVATPPADRFDSENANLGGPIFKRKLFFFAGYQRTHKVTAASSSTMTIPTPAEVKGDFSALLAVAPTAATTSYTCASTGKKLTTSAYNTYQIYNPYTTTADPKCPGAYVRTPVSGNIITNAMTIDPVAAKILSYYPTTPTGSATMTTSGANNYVSTAANLTDTWQEVNRLDYTINNSQKLFGHYVIGTSTQPGKNRYFPGASGKTTVLKNKAAVLDYINTLDANTLLNVRYSLTRFTSTTTIDARTTATDLGINSNATAGIPEKFLGFPYVAFSDGFATLGSADPGYEGDTIHDAQVNLNRSIGRHQVKIGIEWRRYQANQADYTNAKLYVSSKNTYSKYGSMVSSTSLGQAMAEMEMGLAEGTKEALPAATANNTNYWTGYVQDDWKATPQLSLNIGVRYEYFGAIQERNGKSITYLDSSVKSPISDYVVARYAATVATTEAVVLPASSFTQINGGLRFATPGQGVWTPQKYNFSPRFGFSYNPIPKLVSRGGFGIFYQHIGELQQYAQPDGFSQTTSTTASNDSGVTYVGTLANPFPNGLTQPSGNTNGLYQDIGTSISQWFVRNPKSPMSIHYSLGVQYALPGDFMVEANYVGNLGRHSRITRDWNAVPLKYLSTDTSRTSAMTTLNSLLTYGYTNPFYGVTVPVSQSMLTNTTASLSQLLKPYPQYSGVSGSDTAGISSYNALQVSVQKRFSHGYNLTANYTWSRTLDALTFLNAADAKPWYGTSNSDYPQILALSGIYELPFGTGKPFLSNAPNWLKQLVGFQVEGTYRIQSGQPLSFSTDGFLVSGKTYADIKGPSKHNVKQWFNTDAFQSILTDANYANDEAPVSHVRTLPLRFNNVRQDYQNLFNAGAMKKFYFNAAGRRVDAKFRAEAFNALNHQVFTNPTTSPASTSFGSISGPGNSSRYLQFGITMDF
jgi:hypothetical protein